MKKKVIAIVGPTAVGKTALSIELAQTFNGEIISGDSMQVYKGMDIGTAKAEPEEMELVPHHLIDIIQPNEDYTVADFQRDVRNCIEDTHARGNVPILVGGSGLYIESALYNFSFSKQKRDPAYTNKLEDIIEREGIDPLYNRLKEIDPDHAKGIHPNNHRKVIRALEVFETTGKTVTEKQQEQNNDPLFDILFIGLEMERSRLYDRINRRVDLMIEAGLIEEVKKLMDQGFKLNKSMQAIGYKEMISYVEGEVTKETATELLKRNSRRFAKRQYTWFNNRLPVEWYNVSNEVKSEELIKIVDNVAGFLKDS